MSQRLQPTCKAGKALLVVVGAVVLASGCSSVTRPFQTSVLLPEVEASENSRSEDSLQSAISDNREQALLSMAEDRWQSGDSLDCEKLLNRLLESTPDSRDGLQMLAELYLATDRPQLALKEFSLLLQDDPESLDLQYHYAVALEDAGREADANRQFHELAEAAGPDSWLSNLPRSFASGPTPLSSSATIQDWQIANRWANSSARLASSSTAAMR
ncbi:MAG TPA: hypothetical protein EYG57_10730 [Planctomycetes bacterium]|nr:hypothetical protein [Planctomycetota bacterium]